MTASISASVAIRPAIADDLAAVSEIYRHYVENTVATFDYESPTLDDWQAKLEAIADAGRPFLVADSADAGVVGFAYLGEFRSKAAYAKTTEDTIYVRQGFGGRGLGSALLSAVVEQADPDNVTQIVAVIAAEGGDGSIALHRRFGFDEVGRLTKVGRKFDRWIDVVYMQREIG
ncbi:putative acetyltransferase [Gordonia effusa NBRC 100432]|uniref:Putative acetyltransferase n=1 Tax=Gordonia effusa NBRC 100432 TaxID=1077974 RepID=H0R5P3_9ACTN|nr:GNAT family N-acetyltransferase [Gordonia effusa]GAB20394.1 putative acetyltransferase [Gordonia effusa NBRC 100432]